MSGGFSTRTCLSSRWRAKSSLGLTICLGYPTKNCHISGGDNTGGIAGFARDTNISKCSVTGIEEIIIDLEVDSFPGSIQNEKLRNAVGTLTYKQQQVIRLLYFSNLLLVESRKNRIGVSADTSNQSSLKQSTAKIRRR